MSFKRFLFPLLRKLQNYLVSSQSKQRLPSTPRTLLQKFIIPIIPSISTGFAILTYACISEPQQGLNGQLSWGSYASNTFIEDRSAYRVGDQGEIYAAIFDGHGGFQCAEFAQSRLVNAAASLMKENNLESLNNAKIQEVLVQSFDQVETEFINHIRNAFTLGFGDVSRVGACALMAMVYKEHIFVANAGDCRIVLGQQPNRHSTHPSAIPLSFDHNAREPMEQTRLSTLFPTESDIIICKRAGSCYVKGRLQPTRSLGDAYLKYSEFNGPSTHIFGNDRARGRHIPSPYNPPYISAEPEITVRRIQPDDKFLILGSDGVWDYLTNEDAVEIVWGAYQQNKLKEAPTRIIEEILSRAAKSMNTTVEAIRSIPQGPERRKIHDDITVMVLLLEEPPHTNHRVVYDTMNPLTSKISVIE